MLTARPAPVARATDAPRPAPVATLLLEASREAYRLSVPELAAVLADRLGRPTVARLTRTANPNTVTKWRLQKAVPEAPRIHRMLEAYQLFWTLTHLGLSEINAEQWFRGKNPVLGYRMPVDVLSEGGFEEVVAAVRNFAGE